MRRQTPKYYVHLYRNVTLQGECALWLGPFSSAWRDQYAVIQVRALGRPVGVHRITYARKHGITLDEVPPYLHNQCGHCHCITPDHWSIHKNASPKTGAFFDPATVESVTVSLRPLHNRIAMSIRYRVFIAGLKVFECTVAHQHGE